MEHHHVEVLIGAYGISPERVSLLGEFDPEQRGVEIDDPLAREALSMKNAMGRFATVSSITSKRRTSYARVTNAQGVNQKS